jgi:hypothetical protein
MDDGCFPDFFLWEMDIGVMLADARLQLLIIRWWQSFHLFVSLRY